MFSKSSVSLFDKLIIVGLFMLIDASHTSLTAAQVPQISSTGVKTTKDEHNSTEADGKNSTASVTDPAPTAAGSHARQVAADVAVAIITIIVLATIIVMAIYFVKKFEQLNKMVPSYRYSSLKTEINGMNGYDDRIESQSASTEEEDDLEEEEEVSLPPTLVVQSQTTLKSSKSMSLSNSTFVPSASATELKENVSIDSDDELLQ